MSRDFELIIQKYCALNDGILSFYELDVNEYFYAAGVGDICNPAEDLLDSVKW